MTVTAAWAQEEVTPGKLLWITEGYFYSQVSSGYLYSVFWIRIHWVWFLIQHCRLNANSDPDPGFWWPKIGKNLQLDNFFYIKNCYLLIPGPPKRMSKLQEKPAVLKREHPTFQNIKFLNFVLFVGSFLPSWIRFCPPGSGSGSGSTDLIGLDPDPIRIRIWNTGNTVKNIL